MTKAANDNGADGKIDEGAAQSGEGSGDQSKQEGNGGNDSGAGEQKFTQSEMSKVAANEKRQGKSAGRKEVLAELGLDPDDVDGFERFKKLIAAMNDEDEGAQAEKQSAALAEAEERAFIAELKAESMQQGVKPEFVDDLVTLVKARSGEDTDMKTVISEYRTKYPVWFGQTDDEKGESGSIGQKGTGSSVKGDQGGSSAKGADTGIGARLAASRKRGSENRKSYWNN